MKSIPSDSLKKKEEKLTSVDVPNCNVPLICYVINPRTETECDTSFSNQYIKLN